MNKILTSFFVLFLALQLNAQTYQAEAFQDNYTELAGYNSVLLETDGNWVSGYKFGFGFDFPYFNMSYDSIYTDYSGLLFLKKLPERVRMYLLTVGFEMDKPLNMSDLDSDVRYINSERHGKQCLIVQLTKMRILSDPSVEEFNSFVNLQYWFFEDGTIEIRFGPSNLDNSPTYVPGENFYLITGNRGPVPVANEITLFNPENDEIISYGDSSSHEDYFTSSEERLFILWWPPEGWVIRFTRTGVNNEEVRAQNPWNIYSSSGKIELRRAEAASARTSIHLYNSLGQVVAQEELPPGAKQYSLDAGPLAQGIYFYELTSDKGDYQSGRLFVGE